MIYKENVQLKNGLDPNCHYLPVGVLYCSVGTDSLSELSSIDSSLVVVEMSGDPNAIGNVKVVARQQTIKHILIVVIFFNADKFLW